MQEVLFDSSDYVDRSWEILRVLGTEVDKNHPDYPLVRIRLRPDAVFFEPGSDFTTTPYTYYADHDRNQVSWKQVKWPTREFIGFLQGVFRPEGTSDTTPILHIDQNCADIGASRLAFRIDSIAEVGLYSEDAHEIWAAADNAAMDGDTSGYQLIRGYEGPSLTYEEIEPYITHHWPEPTTLYRRHEDS